MPQASDEDRGLMHAYFKNGGINDREPMEYLESKGWKFTRGGLIIKPLDCTPSKQELDCVYFLCDEWDYAFEG